MFGKVELNFTNVYHKKFGKQTIKSWFPRINPPIEPVSICHATLEKKIEDLICWGRRYFPEPADDYFRETAIASVLYIGYGNAMGKLDSVETELGMQFAFWLWLFDDSMEAAIMNKMDIKEFIEGTNSIAKITKVSSNDPKSCSQAVQRCAPQGETCGRGSMFWKYGNCLYQWHQALSACVPELGKKIKRFNICMQRYIQALQWYAADAVNSRYSEASFQAFRKHNSYFLGIADMLALLNGVVLDSEIEDNLVFHRLVDALTSIGAFSNDLLGVKKDFDPEAHDNLVVFKALQKNVNLDTAVNEVSCLLAAELGDYVALKDVLLDNFCNEGNEKGLKDYLAVWECLLHGHLRLYTECSRYKCCGQVTIS